MRLFFLIILLFPVSCMAQIKYPSANTWITLSQRRAHYKSLDLSGYNKKEIKIGKALKDNTVLEFNEVELTTILEYLSIAHQIPIVLDYKSLLDIGLDPKTPLTMNVRGISLRSGLLLLLKDLGLTYIIRDEVLYITTYEQEIQKIKIYSVGDLIILF